MDDGDIDGMLCRRDAVIERRAPELLNEIPILTSVLGVLPKRTRWHTLAPGSAMMAHPELARRFLGVTSGDSFMLASVSPLLFVGARDASQAGRSCLDPKEWFRMPRDTFLLDEVAVENVEMIPSTLIATPLQAPALCDVVFPTFSSAALDASAFPALSVSMTKETEVANMLRDAQMDELKNELTDSCSFSLPFSVYASTPLAPQA